MPDRELMCVYFDQPGPANTPRALELARQRAQAAPGQSVIVASTSGETGALASELLAGIASVVVVSHSTGFVEPNHQELLPVYRARIEAAGARIVTGLHAFGGLGRSVRRKFGTYELDEIVAFVLRNFCEGIKVACEITVMASDAGAVRAGDEVIAIGGTSRGADTVAVLRAANTQDFFDLRVLEILCKPRFGRG